MVLFGVSGNLNNSKQFNTKKVRCFSSDFLILGRHNQQNNRRTLARFLLHIILKKYESLLSTQRF